MLGLVTGEWRRFGKLRQQRWFKIRATDSLTLAGLTFHNGGWPNCRGEERSVELWRVPVYCWQIRSRPVSFFPDTPVRRSLELGNLQRLKTPFT